MSIDKKPKIVVITTGGTIAMRSDPAKGGLVPAIAGSDLIAAIPHLGDICTIDVREFSNIPSAHMTPSLMRDLAVMLEAALSEKNVMGAVITHGTDTLEETAYFLDLYTETHKPVCLTGAMRGADDVAADGPYNVLCAVRTAIAPEARNLGTLVVMNGEIHAARSVTKTHTANVRTFVSPIWGALGYVDDDRIVMCRRPSDRQHLRPAMMAENVPVLKTYTGMDCLLFDFLAEQTIDGLIIEGMGRGNVPASVVSGIGRLLSQGCPIVLTTRVLGGRVLDIYADEGDAGFLKSMGAILGGELSSQKARLKLMLALGVSRDLERLQKFFL